MMPNRARISTLGMRDGLDGAIEVCSAFNTLAYRLSIVESARHYRKKSIQSLPKPYVMSKAQRFYTALSEPPQARSWYIPSLRPTERRSFPTPCALLRASHCCSRHKKEGSRIDLRLLVAD